MLGVLISSRREKMITNIVYWYQENKKIILTRKYYAIKIENKVNISTVFHQHKSPHSTTHPAIKYNCVLR